MRTDAKPRVFKLPYRVLGYTHEDGSPLPDDIATWAVSERSGRCARVTTFNTRAEARAFAAAALLDELGLENGSGA